MKHCYISNKIILFLYGELSALNHIEVEYAIEHEPEWRAKYLELSKAHKKLPQVQYYPKNRIVKSLLNYSAATA